MNSLVLPLYAFAFLLASFVILLAFKLGKKFNLPYLKYYLYFLLSFNIIILLNVGKFHIFIILQEQPILLYVLIMSVFNLLAFPLYPIAIYTFLRFILDLLEIELSPFFKKAQLVFWIAVFLFFVYVTVHFQNTKDISLIRTLYQSLSIFIHVSLFLIIFILFFNL